MDSSESNADSLEHQNDIDPLQIDLSPTIFELDPDSLSHSTKPNQENLDSQISKCEELQHSNINIVLSVTPTNSMTQVIDGESNHPTAIETNSGFTGKLILTRDDSLLVTEPLSTPLPKRALSRMNISPVWIDEISIPTNLEKYNISPKIQPSVANTLVTRHIKLFNDSVSQSSLDSDSSEQSSKKSLGFYVDLSSMPDVAAEQAAQENFTEKKNIFSMYIELGDNSNVKAMPKKLSSSLNIKNTLETSSRNSSFVKCSIDSTNSAPVKEPPDVQCGENIPESLSKNELPIIPSIDLRRKKDNFEIWNTTGSENDCPKQVILSQKRTQSVNLESLDTNIAITKDKDCTSGISPIDDYTYSKSEMSSFSSSSHSKQPSESHSLPAVADAQLHYHKEAGAVITDGNDNLTFHPNRSRHMAETNESFYNGGICATANDFSKDITACTITDKNDITCQYDLSWHRDNQKLEKKNEACGSLSQLIDAMEINDLSSTAVFEEVEKLCNTMTDEKVDSTCSITDIVVLMQARELKKNQEKTKKTEVETKMENLQAAIVKQKQILAAGEKAESEQQKRDNAFVRLSDLDKALPMVSLDSARDHTSCDMRMTRSIPEPYNKDHKKGTMSQSTNIFSSFHSENAVSLSRLFPQLKEEFSRSSSNTLDVSPTEVTSESSNDQNEAPNSQKRLGNDLLQMFLKGIASDVTVDVDGRRIKAHKCILASRCQYFAAMLSGGWVESAGNVLSISGFSYNVVHFALRHIYSGVSTIPESISIMELTMLAEKLRMEGLKEVIEHKLKEKYCHMFHKPCAICSIGVLDCLPISAIYGLDKHYLESIHWITKYFVRIWPMKKFAKLPKQLIEKCYQAQLVNMSVNNVLATVSGCGRISYDVSKESWGDSVRGMCQQLICEATHFISINLVQVLQTSVQGAITGDVSVWVGLEAIEECLTNAFELAPAQQMCLTYQWLFNLNTERETLIQLASSGDAHVNSITPELDLDIVPGTELEWRLVERWMLRCEEVMLRNIGIISQSKAWLQLEDDLQGRLKRTFDYIDLDMSPSPLKKKSEKKLCYNPSSPRPSTSRGITRPRQRKSTVEDHLDESCRLKQIRTTLTLQQQTKVNQKKTKVLLTVKGSTKAQTIPRPIVQPPKKLNTRLDESKIPNMENGSYYKPKKYQNVLPRYMEPRPNRERVALNLNVNMCRPNQTKKKVSSSESSLIQTGLGLRSRTESRKCLKGPNAVVKAAGDKSSSESSTVHTSTATLCIGNSSECVASRLKVGKDHLRAANEVKKTNADVTSSRMSRLKTGTSTAKANPESLSNLSTFNLVSSSLPSQRSPIVQAPVTDLPLTPKRFRNKPITITSPNEKKQKPANKPLKTSLSETVMKPTKSSSAKVVTKIPQSNQNLSKSECNKKTTSNRSEEVNKDGNRDVHNIPVMQRSGTFLIEED